MRAAKEAGEKGKQTTYILCICVLRREASRAKRRGNAKAEDARRSFAKKRRYYHNNGQSHHLFPRSDAPRRCSIFLERFPGENRVSPPNSRGVYIYKFKMIILSVGVWQTEVICALSASGVVPLSRTLSTVQAAMAMVAAVADRPIMPFVKTGHGVSRLSDARNSRASLRELATREKKYRATRGIVRFRRISLRVSD